MPLRWTLPPPKVVRVLPWTWHLKGAFEGGGDPAEIDLSDPNKELEDLFDRLNKTPQERKMMRDSYLSRGAIDELLAHLRGGWSQR